MTNIPAKSPPNGAWRLRLAFAIFAITITMAGYAVFHSYRKEMTLDAQKDLSGISALKIEQITNWMNERKGDAQTIMESPFFLAEVERWLEQGGPNNESKGALMNRLTLPARTQTNQGYTTAYLFDDKARLRLFSPGDNDSEVAHERQEVLESMRSGKIILSDIHEHQRAHDDRHEYQIDLVAPLFTGKGKSAHVIGAVLFHLDPRRFLFPLIQKWPTPMLSAENMLVRREGDDMVIMNESDNGKPLDMRFPLNRQESLAARAALGQEGLAEGVDHRGVPVVGVLNKVPGTSWSIVSKIDKSEIYAPINHLAAWVLLLMTSLVGASAGIAVVWRRKEGMRYENEQKNQALTKRLDYLVKYANDIILMHDRTGKIIDFNDRALEAYGYTVEEFYGLNLAFLRAIELTPPLEEIFDEINSSGALTFDSSHVRKNGSVFPVEASVRVVEIGGEKYYQAIVRDISERKKLEQGLADNAAYLKTLVRAIPDLIWMKNEKGIYQCCNQTFEHFLGAKEVDIVGKTDYDFADKELADCFREHDRKAMQSAEPCTHEEWLNFADGSHHGLFETIKTPMFDNEGRLLGVMGIARDITHRQLAKDALSASVATLSAILNNFPYNVWLKDTDGRYLQVNKAFADYVRATNVQEVIGKTDFDLWPPELAEKFRQDDAEIMAARQQKHVEEASIDGDKPHWVKTFKAPVIDEKGKVLGTTGFSYDITERKVQEELLHFHSSILKSLSEGIFLVRSSDGVIVFANQPFENMFGYAPDELLGKHMSVVNAPGEDSPDAIASGINAALDSYGAWSGEVHNIRKDGTVFWCAASVSTLDHPRFGNVWVAVHEDITERKIAEMAIKKSEERFRTMFDRASEGILIMSARGQLVSVNESFARMHGYTPQEMQGMDLKALDTPASFALAPERVRRILSEGTGHFEVEHYHKDGHVFPLEVSASMLVVDGEPVVQSFVRDITQRKRAENALQRSETILRTLYNSTSDAVMLLGDNGFLDCNKAALNMFGYASKEEFCTKHPADISPPQQPCGGDSKMLSMQNNATALEQGRHFFEWVYRRADNGEDFSVEVLLDKMELDGSAILQATVRDITERKQKELELQRFEAIVDSTDDAIISMTMDGIIRSWNCGAENIFGYAAAEVLEKSIQILRPADCKDEEAEILSRILRGERIQHYETLRRCKDGRLIGVSDTVSPIYGGQGRVVGVSKIVRDITARKQAEDALRKLSLAVEQSPSSVIITDPDANIEYVNQAFVMETGYCPEEVIRKNPRLLNSGKNPKSVYQEMWTRLSRGEVWKGELINRRKDGSEYISSSLISPVRNEDGRISHLLSVREDVTERKKNIAEIERLSRAYRLLSRVNEMIVRVKDRDVLFTALCSATIESMLFRFIWIGMLDEQRSRVIPVAHAGVEEGYIAKLNIRLDDERTGNGPTGSAIRTGLPTCCQDIQNDPRMEPWREEAFKRGYASSAVFPIYEMGEVTGAITVYVGEVNFFTPEIADLMRELASNLSFALNVMAERKRRELAEAEIKQLNVELEQRVRERTRQLEIANEELESFSYSVSHDLRAPLRSIDGFSQILLKKYQSQLDPDGKDYLSRVSKASQRMGVLIDDLLQLSRVARVDLKYARIDLSLLAAKIFSELSIADPARVVQIVIQQELTACADLGLMRIVMDNLLGNAWKYSSKMLDARIEFGSCAATEGQVFFVRDNGEGFDMEHAHKLFGAFQRLHSAHEFEGTGIGLVTVRRIIRRHQGNIWVEAKPGKGATFYFTLPFETFEDAGANP